GARRAATAHSESPGRTTVLRAWSAAPARELAAGRRSGVAREPPSAAPACAITSTDATAMATTARRRRQYVARVAAREPPAATAAWRSSVVGRCRAVARVVIVMTPAWFTGLCSGGVARRESEPRGCDSYPWT